MIPSISVQNREFQMQFMEMERRFLIFATVVLILMRSHLLEFKLGSRQPLRLLAQGYLWHFCIHMSNTIQEQNYSEMVDGTIELNISSLQHT